MDFIDAQMVQRCIYNEVPAAPAVLRELAGNEYVVFLAGTAQWFVWTQPDWDVFKQQHPGLLAYWINAGKRAQARTKGKKFGTK